MKTYTPKTERLQPKAMMMLSKLALVPRKVLYSHFQVNQPLVFPAKQVFVSTNSVGEEPVLGGLKM